MYIPACTIQHGPDICWESPSHRPMGPIDLPVSDFGILAGSFLYVEWWHCTNLDNSYLPGTGIHIPRMSRASVDSFKKKRWLDIGCQWNTRICQWNKFLSWFNWTGLKIRKSLGETTHIKESLNSIIPVTDSQESHLTTASTLPNSSYKCCKKWSLIQYIYRSQIYVENHSVQDFEQLPADFPHASSSVIQIQQSIIR